MPSSPEIHSYGHSLCLHAVLPSANVPRPARSCPASSISSRRTTPPWKRSACPTATPEPGRGERTAAVAIRRPFSCYCPLRLCAGSLGSVRSRSGVLGGLGAVGALCGGTFGRDEIVRRVDDSDVREGLREVPKLAA